MANKFAFKLNGINDLIKDLKYLTESVVKNMDVEIAGSAETIVVNAKSAVPRKTGAGANSIGHTRNALLDYTITSAEHYMPYVEFGTGGLVDVPNGLEDYAIQFKGKGIRQVNLPARPFLFPAYEAERVRLVERLKKELLRASMSGITVLQLNGNGNITGTTTI